MYAKVCAGTHIRIFHETGFNEEMAVQVKFFNTVVYSVNILCVTTCLTKGTSIPFIYILLAQNIVSNT